MKNPTTLLEKYRAIQAIGIEVDVPFHVSRCFTGENRPLSIFGSEICLGEDFVSLEDARNAVEWYVQQLGGKVQWK